MNKLWLMTTLLVAPSAFAQQGLFYQCTLSPKLRTTATGETIDLPKRTILVDTDSGNATTYGLYSHDGYDLSVRLFAGVFNSSQGIETKLRWTIQTSPTDSAKVEFLKTQDFTLHGEPPEHFQMRFVNADTTGGQLTDMKFGQYNVYVFPVDCQKVKP